MKAYKNSQYIKDKYADDYFDFSQDELGIPYWMVSVLDAFHESMQRGCKREFIDNILAAITPGVDLDQVRAPFVIFLLDNCEKTIEHACLNDELKNKIVDAIHNSRKSCEKSSPPTDYIDPVYSADEIDHPFCHLSGYCAKTASYAACLDSDDDDTGVGWAVFYYIQAVATAHHSNRFGGSFIYSADDSREAANNADAARDLLVAELIRLIEGLTPRQEK